MHDFDNAPLWVVIAMTLLSFAMSFLVLYFFFVM